MNVILYSTGCPRCKVLKSKLDSKNISYNICSDIDVMAELGIEAVPALQVNDSLYDFSEANIWVNNYSTTSGDSNAD